MLLPPQYVLHSVTQPNLNPRFFFCHLSAQLLCFSKMRQPPSSVDKSQRTLTQSFSSTRYPYPPAKFASLAPAGKPAARITAIITNIWHELAVDVSSTSQHVYVMEVVTPVGTSYLVSDSTLRLCTCSTTPHSKLCSTLHSCFTHLHARFTTLPVRSFQHSHLDQWTSKM